MRGPTSERKKLCNRPGRNGDDATEEEEEEEPVLIRCASYFPHSSFSKAAAAIFPSFGQVTAGNERGGGRRGF